nr:ankyrin repeat-containing protein [Quercus suber]
MSKVKLPCISQQGHAAIVDVLIKRARERAPQENLENGVNYAVQKMLEMTNNGKDTALHEAVRGDHLKVVERLIKEGRDFSYSQNDAGETPLYMAVGREFKEVAFHILETCTSPAHDGPLGRTTLHAAEITLEFSDKRRPVEFRRPLGDDILSKRKDYIYKWQPNRVQRERWEAERKARKDRFVSIMEKASQSHLVVDTLIATVAFTAGITMPGGFIGQEGPRSGSPVLMRNTAFKAFIITNTIAMLQSCSAAFIQLFMPLLFLDKDPGDFSFLLALLAFCLSISAMGAMVLAFVMGTYAVLMHSLGLANANSIIGLFFFIPLFVRSKTGKSSENSKGFEANWA